MPTSAKKRARAATRARTTLPQQRRSTSRKKVAQRRTIILGIVVAGSLLIALVATFSSINPTTPSSTVPSQSDPAQLIRAATANPNDSDAVGNLADYYDKTGQYQQALVLYQRYLVLRPDDALARVNFGELLRNTGDLQSAQAQLLQALTFASATTDQRTVARAHFDLGDIYQMAQPPRLNDALREFQQAAQLNPGGDVGNQAAQQIANVQQQLSVSTVTVIAPTLPASGVPATPAARPTGTP